MSLFDLLWIGLLLYAVLSGLSKKKRPPRAGGEETRAAGASRPSVAEEMRRRLLEAAQEWEAEQRRRRGEPPVATAEPPEALPAAPVGDRTPVAKTHRARRPSPSSKPARAERPARGEERRRRFVVHDVTPDREPEAPAAWEPPTPQPPAIREPTEPARRPAGQPARPAAIEAPAAAQAVSSLEAPAQSRSGAGAARTLARLDRYSPLRRAILYSEILGRPKGLDEFGQGAADLP